MYILNFFKNFIMYIYRFIRNCYRKYHWENTNMHNRLVLKDYSNYKNIIAGSHSYGVIDALFHSSTGEKLYIGNFCSIAPNVLFIVASDHNYRDVSTYPFKVMIKGDKYEALSKGDIVLKDDVWIGANSIILSGITINQGAIVAAGSVVTKDIPPYAIVGGNPAKIIKYRFSQKIIEKLLNIDFSKLSNDIINRNINTLYSEITEENIDEIIKSLHI